MKRGVIWGQKKNNGRKPNSPIDTHIQFCSPACMDDLGINKGRSFFLTLEAAPIFHWNKHISFGKCKTIGWLKNEATDKFKNHPPSLMPLWSNCPFLPKYLKSFWRPSSPNVDLSWSEEGIRSQSQEGGRGSFFLLWRSGFLQHSFINQSKQ